MTRDKRLRHIALLPRVEMVGIHQIFKIVERNYCKAERQRHQNNKRQQPANGGSVFLGDV
jgi:hypothetical protein